MKSTLLLLLTFVINFSYSQENSQDLNFNFSGTFNISLENNPQVDFDQVEVFSNGFHLKSQNQILRSYQIVSRNPKTGFELNQTFPIVSQDFYESTKLVVYPDLIDDRLSVQVYSSQGYSLLVFNKKSNN